MSNTRRERELKPLAFLVFFFMITISCFVIYAPNCSAAVRKQSLGQQFSWLTNYAGKSGWKVVCDARYDALIKAIVPNKSSYLLGAHSNLQEDCATVTLAAPDVVLLKDGRYFIFDGFVPNDAQQKGLVWLDLKSTDAAFVVVHYFGPNGKLSDTPMVYIASRTILVPEKMPTSLKAALNSWLNREGLDPMVIRLNGVVSNDLLK